MIADFGMKKDIIQGPLIFLGVLFLALKHVINNVNMPRETGMLSQYSSVM